MTSAAVASLEGGLGLDADEVFAMSQPSPLRSFPEDLARAQGRKYVVNPDTGCWEWFGSLHPGGYALRSLPPADRKRLSNLAHRHFYFDRYGVLPDTLDHLCRVRHCVNPNHLEPVARGENVRRGMSAKLTWPAVAEMREAMADGARNKELAARFGVAACTVSQVRHGHIWKEEHRP